MMEGTTTPPGTPTKTGSLVSQKEGEEWYSKLASSYLIFLIVTAIVLAFVTAIFITNTVYYDKINKNKGCSGAVTESEANILFWLNLILAVISGIFFLAAVVLAFIQFEEPKWTEKYIGRISYTPGTVSYASLARKGAARVQARAARVPGRVRADYANLRERGGAVLAAARDPDIVKNQRALQRAHEDLQGQHAALQYKHAALQEAFENLGVQPGYRGGIDPSVISGLRPQDRKALCQSGALPPEYCS